MSELTWLRLEITHGSMGNHRDSCAVASHSQGKETGLLSFDKFRVVNIGCCFVSMGISQGCTSDLAGTSQGVSEFTGCG